MKGNIAQLMQQAQKMQEQMKKAQEELGQLEVQGQSGGGMVMVSMNGRHEVRRVTIDPELAHDIDMLEDLVAAAVNDAIDKVQVTSQEKMAGLTAGLNLPPGFQLP